MRQASVRSGDGDRNAADNQRAADGNPGILARYVERGRIFGQQDVLPLLATAPSYVHHHLRFNIIVCTCSPCSTLHRITLPKHTTTPRRTPRSTSQL